jgi:hypothetical protein
VGLGLFAGMALLFTPAVGLPRLIRNSVDLGTGVVVVASGIVTVTPLVIATAIGLLPSVPPVRGLAGC